LSKESEPAITCLCANAKSFSFDLFVYQYCKSRVGDKKYQKFHGDEIDRFHYKQSAGKQEGMPACRRQECLTYLKRMAKG
jgi:hypothetical protein